jgi:hypothetical protein
MKPEPRLIVTNVLAVLILATVLLAGWWDAALFGLAVLLAMDLVVLLRARVSRSKEDRKE